MTRTVESSGRLRGFRPYPDYKDSSIEGLATIPTEWDNRRLKYLADRPIRNGVGEAAAFDDPDWPRYVRITDIAGPRSLRNDTFRSLPPDIAKQAPLDVGDILLAAVGATYGKSYLHAEDIGAACFAGFLVKFSPAASLNPSFAAYWAESHSYWDQVRSRVVQATIQNFSAAKYKNLIIPFPPADQQETIVRFLDYETAKIDALIEKQQQLIRLLEEKRQAVISHTVTKGLDPGSPTRHSHVEWLGEVPASWEVSPLGYLSEITVGIVVTPAKFYVDTGVPCLRSLNVRPGYLRKEELVYISAASNDLHSKSKIHAGDVVVVRTGQPGTAAAVDEDMDGCNCIDLIIVRQSHRLVPEFLVYQMNSDHVSLQVSSGSGGAIQQHFNVGVAKKLKVVLPSNNEQEEIVRYLDDQTGKLDTLIGKAQDAANLLSERRTALVSAAVTGKIDVRGWEPPCLNAEVA